ncbi:MAG TPA: hypothetical protein VHS81_03085 [Caulobacteraceae bacterium]|jgi:hypothetical protein|nr:hypothetical protein [Caulobacteraceae bacterium]
MRHAAIFPLAAAAALVVAHPAFAQTADAPASRPLTREELEAALKERDAEIAALEKRVAALESGRGAPVATAGGAARNTQPGVVQTATGAPSPANSQTASAGGDEEQLRALSRGLVERGLQLLPKWSVEVAPSVAYSHTQTQGLVLVQTPEGISTVDDQRQRDDAIEGAVTARVGLPWQSQLQLTVPVDWRRQDSALGDGTTVAHQASGLGDVQVELSHQFLTESGWRPDLIGAVGARFPTGSDPYRTSIAAVASGLGTTQITGRLTALKTVDPLVLYSTLSYSANLPYRESIGEVHTGDNVDWQLGGLLAVSPDTSLSFGFDQQFRQDTRVNGVAIPGSNGLAGIALFGIDQVLSSRVLVDLTLGVGLTHDAPDYTFMISVPIRLR